VPTDDAAERAAGAAGPTVIDPGDLPAPDDADFGDLEHTVDRAGSPAVPEPNAPEVEAPRGPGRLVPLDFPDRLSARGLRVSVIGGWETRGRPADHRAGVLHHTASNVNASIQAEVSGHINGKPGVPGPLCNVTIARDCTVYVNARLASNNAGKISPTAYAEACAGRAELTPAHVRGLDDAGSQNSHLFGIECCNNGVGEPWSRKMIETAATVAAVVCTALGWSERHWTTHRALTERKIDPNWNGDWHAEIRARLGVNPLGIELGPNGREPVVSTLPVVVPAGKAGPRPDIGNRYAFFTHDDESIIGWNSAAIGGDAPSTTDADSIRGKTHRFMKVPVVPPAKVIGISYGTKPNGDVDYKTIVAYASDGATYAYESV
jgi:hypothetical protein